MAALVTALVVLNLALIPAVFTAWNLWFYRPPPPGARDPKRRALPKVSVLIPARNEARTIGKAIASLLRSDGVDLEVLVMDDHSADQTAAIVADFARQDSRVRLMTAPKLPPGWCGKQHACWELARNAQHPLLLFQDADVRLAPDAIAGMVRVLERGNIDLLSGFPRLLTGSLLEKLVIPLVHFLLLGYLPMIGMRYSRHVAFGVGCGQIFLTHREAYQSMGGHRAIAATRHDGITLPRAYRRAGLRTDLLDVSGLAECRMYSSARELWNGFAKNADEGMAAPAAIIPWTLLLLGGQVLPIFWTVWLVLTGSLAGVTATAVVVAAVVAYSTRFTVTWRFRQSWWGAVLHPLGVLIVMAIQWYALVRSLAGKPVAWKGRAPA